MFKTLMAAAGAASLCIAAATPAAAYDARNPSDVLSTLGSNGASASMEKDSDGTPYILGKAGKLKFEVRFYRCNPGRTVCDVAIYQLGFDSELATVDQINGWNKWAFLCGAYLGKENHPYVWYGVRTSIHDTSSDVANQQNEWLSCVADFDKFTDGPDAFLKSHN